jgi:hypothetical protein
MKEPTLAHVIIGDSEYTIAYDPDRSQNFMRAVWKLWLKARELDVLPSTIEPNDMIGLQLLAQMQLVDEAELKKLVAKIARVLKSAKSVFTRELQMRYAAVLGHWMYTKKPLNIIRKQSDLDFHSRLAVSELVSILEDLKFYYLDEINDLYPGQNYRQRFLTSLLDKLIEKR